jgi:perosamine synthetase
MSSRSSTARSAPSYEDGVRGTFASLKRAGEPRALTAIPIAGGGRLVPVAGLHARDAELIATLALWRAASAHAFASEATVTTEGTERWIRMGLLDAEDRMLWLVTGRDGRALGHMGFANALNPRRELELDNVVRGERSVEPGIMGRALGTLTRWAEQTLGPATISLRVLADNAHARAFYRRLGWHEERRIPLRRNVEHGVVYYDEADDCAAPDRELVRMLASA